MTEEKPKIKLDFEYWLEQEQKGRRKFLEALKQTGLDLLHLAKNEDKYGVDVIILLEDLEATNWKCVGTIEIENSEWLTWDYSTFGKKNGWGFPPTPWRYYAQITVPYRRVPRVLVPKREIYVAGQAIQIGINQFQHFYQKWDSSLTAFYMTDFEVLREAIYKESFIYKPENSMAESYTERDYINLFQEHHCEEFWREDAGNWFINLWDFRANIIWGAFDINNYDGVVRAIKHIWDKCGIRYKDKPGEEYKISLGIGLF